MVLTLVSSKEIFKVSRVGEEALGGRFGVMDIFCEDIGRRLDHGFERTLEIGI